jgi:hypothetical protein
MIKLIKDESGRRVGCVIVGKEPKKCWMCSFAECIFETFNPEKVEIVPCQEEAYEQLSTD